MLLTKCLLSGRITEYAARCWAAVVAALGRKAIAKPIFRVGTPLLRAECPLRPEFLSRSPPSRRLRPLLEDGGLTLAGAGGPGVPRAEKPSGRESAAGFPGLLEGSGGNPAHRSQSGPQRALRAHSCREGARSPDLRRLGCMDGGGKLFSLTRTHVRNLSQQRLGK